MKRYFNLVFLIVLGILVFQGCLSGKSYQKRKITVVDKSGVPIVGANTLWTPFTFRKKDSDDKGKMWIYGTAPDQIVWIKALGYVTQEFKFSDPITVCIMTKGFDTNATPRNKIPIELIPTDEEKGRQGVKN